MLGFHRSGHISRLWAAVNTVSTYVSAQYQLTFAHDTEMKILTLANPFICILDISISVFFHWIKTHKIICDRICENPT